MKCKECGHEIEEDFTKVVCKKLKKEIRIYKWEDKKFKDFKMPKGFKWCEVFDFMYLYDNDLIKVEDYPICYYLSSLSKKDNKGACRLGRDRNGYWSAGWGGLDSSGDDGRVVISKELD